MNHYDELISSHTHSFVYNQLNIRVDSWKTKNDIFEINTSRTIYFNTLVTNRAVMK